MRTDSEQTVKKSSCFYVVAISFVPKCNFTFLLSMKTSIKRLIKEKFHAFFCLHTKEASALSRLIHTQVQRLNSCPSFFGVNKQKIVAGVSRDFISCMAKLLFQDAFSTRTNICVWFRTHLMLICVKSLVIISTRKEQNGVALFILKMHEKVLATRFSKVVIKALNTVGRKSQKCN